MAKSALDLPVLLITFNRPDVAQVVLNRIVEASPPRIYIFNDAPRTGNNNDRVKCEEVRSIVLNLSYHGEIITRFEEENLGCKMGVSSATSWFFEHEEMGIILEDDTLPSLDFFLFCQEMLLKYRNDERIFSIGGCNLINSWKHEIQDYHFALYGSYWGWAGWRRSWNHYNVNMPEWSNPAVRDLIMKYLPNEVYRKLRSSEFDSLVSGRTNTWDFQFCFAHFINHALSIVPAKNMIVNIGIRHEQAVHMSEESPFSDLSHFELNFPLRHNPIMVPDYEYDERAIKKAYPFLYEAPYSPPPPKDPTLIEGIKSILPNPLKSRIKEIFGKQRL